ncbi:hypothetical protein G7Y89_g12616 [Cudoniella acicularis]|uniref:Carrier domain-containing protein n=1 Tax=Cudoniella acicularis TaxID=354080 RepID=A0A8H4RC97_9HELO|nr:hypothetical protein G7Y89_g12616 [Cudoniella acicularis]
MTSNISAGGGSDLFANGHSGTESQQGNKHLINSNNISLNGVSNNEVKSSGAIERVDANSSFTPVAICGMACRLPGGIRSPQELWDFLLSKGDARTRVPQARLNIDAYYSPTDKPGTVKTQHGYFLDEDLAAFDASLFAISPAEIEHCDPQQMQMLEVARECIEDAGETSWRGRKVGVYMGNYGEDWAEMCNKEPQQYDFHNVIGMADFTLANCVSYEMDLRGPSMTIRTACSSALVALNEACMAIGRGECESAIVGGSNPILAPGMTAKMIEIGVLSPDGSCKTFSADANGYARGEAINAIYIKSLNTVFRDGNPVREIIAGIATNHDGKTPGLSYPSAEAQEALMRRAYEVAGIKEFSETAFVECHGAGTPVGDPVEVSAVSRVFGNSGIYIGSVKSNFGHLEGALGLTSVVKSVMALENHTIPPNIKFNTPNLSIPFESAKLIVPIEPTPWPTARGERISVNSFGIGAPILMSFSTLPPVFMLAMSWKTHRTHHNCLIADVAFTLASKREHLPYRAFVVSSREQPGRASPVAKPSQTPAIIMVFTGQGAQWPQMGRDLFRSNKSGESRPEWTIESEMRNSAKTSRLGTAELSQPISTAIRIALVDALTVTGIAPTAVVGHSSGEITGAYASGALSAEEAITAAFHRGLIAKKQTRMGTMAAVGMSWTDAKKYLIPGVSVACEYSPKSVMLSGDADKVETVISEIQKARTDVLARLLKVDKAYHSYHMTEVGEDYHRLIKDKILEKTPAKPFFSRVTGKLLEVSEQLGARYWQKNLESPVLFRSAVSSVVDHPIRQNTLFLEIGPHSALAGPIRQILTEKSSTAPGIQEGFKLRNFIVSTALVVPEEEPVELITTFRQLRLTNSLNSSWWEFTIASHNGQLWSKHCIGEVTTMNENLGLDDDTAKLPRSVSVRDWYESYRRSNFNYEPQFQLFESIRSSTVAPGLATAEIRDDSLDGSQYNLHPTIVDNLLHLITIASLLEQPLKCRKNLPTSIRELSISHCSSKLVATASGACIGNGSTVGNCQLIAGGKIVLKASGIKLITMEEPGGNENHAAARQIWSRRIDFVGAEDLLKLCYDRSLYTPNLDELAQLCDIFNKLQAFANSFDISSFLQCLAHTKPNLRVLELGAGTGSSTAKIPTHLIPLYSKYTLSDFSSSLFASVERLKDSSNIEFAQLDISRDLEEQGFQDREFDLIIATNIMHKTESLSKSLNNTRKLLHPEGRLLLQELCPSSKWVNYIFGVFKGWWRGATDNRVDDPYIEMDSWETMLYAAGFQAPDAIVLDSKNPFQLNTIVVARPHMEKPANKQVTLFFTNKMVDHTQISNELLRRGYKIEWTTIEEPPMAGRDVISILDQDSPFLEGLTADNLIHFKAFLSRLGGSGVFWITSLSSIYCKDPRYAQILGFARTMRSEMGIDVAVCQTEGSWGDSKVVDIFEKFQRRIEDPVLTPEMEHAIYESQVNVGRLFPITLADELLTSEMNDRIVLSMERPGRLTDLHWSRRQSEAPQEDQVEVEVYCAGLNFRDLLVAKNTIELPETLFGFEAAGIVRRIGPKVANRQVGDRVMMLGHNTFSSLVTESELLCVKIPDELSFSDAATMPLVYITALYCLVDVARLEKGQSILIHGGSGGIGIAAIQIAQYIGAELYVTVSNEEKVRYLMKTFNLPRNRIFRSRETSFARKIMQETNGKGVDVVLNSLSGELLHATWNCIAEFGKMIEIGNTNHLAGGKLDMGGFLLNRGYYGVDIDRIRTGRPVVLARLLASIKNLFLYGYVQPIRSIKIFDATNVRDAFGYTQEGLHLGKIVLEIRQSPERTLLESAGHERKKTPIFDSGASYLLVGGLGGLGRSVSVWMVEHGARHLIFLSRSAGSHPEDSAFTQEPKSMGCGVELVRGSVVNLEDVGQAIKSASVTRPFKGILQMSMVLRDQGFPAMTWEDWQVAISPKIQATWNLHNCTAGAGIELDFFVLFSSISGVIGPPEDIGVLAGQKDSLRQVSAIAGHRVKARDLIDALVVTTIPPSLKSKKAWPLATYTDPAAFVLGLASTTSLSSAENRVIWRKDPRMAVHHNTSTASLESGDSAASNSLKTFLASARTDPAILQTSEVTKLLAVEIGRKLQLSFYKHTADALPRARLPCVEGPEGSFGNAANPASGGIQNPSSAPAILLYITDELLTVNTLKVELCDTSPAATPRLDDLNLHEITFHYQYLIVIQILRLPHLFKHVLP